MSSMRSRGAAASRRTRSGIRAVYEDFKPSFEWKHEDGASVLLYHLPGFVKEQIRIIAESRGILRVRGERLISGNKWSRFQEEVVVPEDCNMNEIRAKFEGGILRITMPKKITTTGQKHPIEEESNKMDEAPRPRPNQQPKPQEGQPSPKPPPLALALPLPPVEEAPTSSRPPQPQKLHGTTTSPMKLPSVSHSQNNEDVPDYSNSNSNSNSKAKEIKQQPRPDDFDDSSHKGMPNEHQQVVYKKDEEVYADALDQDKSSIYDFNKIDKFGNPLLKRLDQDRQLLTNMGVAVLVIVALAAHIAYSFAPTA